MHFDEARDAPRAVHYLGQAAQNALRRSAGREAADLLTRALDQLQTLHETPERAQQELSLQASLGAALLMSRGYTAPEVKHAYDRAHALSGQASPQIFPAVFGLFRFELLRGELRTARSIAEQLLRLAQAKSDPFLVPAAQAALGAALFHLGEPAAARAHVEQGLRAYDRHRQEALLLQLGEDPGVVCLRYAGFALQVLGYPDQALARSREARALAEALSHPFSLVGEVCSSAFLYRLRRDVRAVQAQAEAALTLVSEHALPVWGELAALARGWALAEQGQVEQMRHALGLMHTVGFYLSRPQHLVLPAEAYGRAGRANEGFGMLEEALATAQRTGERWYEAELYRLNGELMLQQSGSGVASPEPEAEACFLRSVDIARSQEARLFELRAAMSLARLQQRQGKDEQANPQLAEVYGWFTEGFDTKDLQEARELLETSGGTPSCRC
jgi:tetratricopeptide (TPR) repeat protein